MFKFNKIIILPALLFVASQINAATGVYVENKTGENIYAQIDYGLSGDWKEIKEMELPFIYKRSEASFLPSESGKRKIFLKIPTGNKKFTYYETEEYAFPDQITVSIDQTKEAIKNGQKEKAYTYKMKTTTYTDKVKDLKKLSEADLIKKIKHEKNVAKAIKDKINKIENELTALFGPSIQKRAIGLKMPFDTEVTTKINNLIKQYQISSDYVLDGSPLIVLASLNRNYDIVEILIKFYQANVMAKDIAGNTALHAAAMSSCGTKEEVENRHSIVKTLIAADKSNKLALEKNNKGLKAIDILEILSQSFLGLQPEFSQLYDYLYERTYGKTNPDYVYEKAHKTLANENDHTKYANPKSNNTWYTSSYEKSKTAEAFRPATKAGKYDTSTSQKK